ncbi:MAG: IMP cyclohydrolase [Patescibacteria group bacterium]
MKRKKLAQENLLKLKNNPYPGRGIIVGMDETGKYLVQVYWIMGRSENSRNRIFVVDDDDSHGTLKTAAADPAKVKDPSLIIYTAMYETLTRYAVSNGHQTGSALAKRGLKAAMESWQYEPDSPNFTPRITAVMRPRAWEKQIAEISILKKSQFSDACQRDLYVVPISTPGLGYCVTTYSGDGNPLPSFEGNPYLLPLTGGIYGVTQTIWDVLNEENRVSLAVKFIEIETRETFIEIVNKYNAVG